MTRFTLILSLCSVALFLPMAVLPAAETPRSRMVADRTRPVLEKRLAERGFAWGSPGLFRIFKVERVLELWIKQGEWYELFETFPILGMSGTLGPKLKQGDMQSPEGFYNVPLKGLWPASNYHLAFDIGYPNAYDRAYKRTGKYIMVHGGLNSTGCFAMGDTAVETIWTLAEAALKNRQEFFRVHIFPFRMTEANMAAHAQSPWSSFWQNLKTGYEWFEREHVPPAVVTRQGRYCFGKAPE